MKNVLRSILINVEVDTNIIVSLLGDIIKFHINYGKYVIGLENHAPNVTT